ALAHVGKHIVTGDAMVVATNVPVNNLLAIHTKQAPYMTYVVGARVPAGSVPKVLAWDTGDPYHYIRLHDDVLIVGGEDHKSGQATDSPRRDRGPGGGEAGCVPRRQRRLPRVPRRLRAPRLQRAMESGREELGLPLPRLALARAPPRDEGSSEPRSSASEARGP